MLQTNQTKPIKITSHYIMQLKKQAIRKTATFEGKRTPQGNSIGILRNPADFNQKKNKQQRNRNKRGDQ
jgi:hypothetical protein